MMRLLSHSCISLIALPGLFLGSSAVGTVPTPAAPSRPSAKSAPQTILFIGNSFTYGGHSAAWKYRADTVIDLNGTGVGGVPALFKLFADESGLNFRVSLETEGGKTLKWHWDNKRELVDRPWDHVVLQDLSELSRSDPGNPSELIDYSGRFAHLFRKRDPKADISLTSTWSRPDLTYQGHSPWTGKPITQMAIDLRAAYDRARQANRDIGRVHPVGQAFNCAIAAGVADGDPYDGIAGGKVDLWTYDNYHASAAGYYLEALTIFADVTGKDPRSLGKDEEGAAELGIAPAVAATLQGVAFEASTRDGLCGGTASARS